MTTKPKRKKPSLQGFYKYLKERGIGSGKKSDDFSRYYEEYLKTL